MEGARSGSVVECLTRDRRAAGFEPHRGHCLVSLSKNINPSLVLVQPRKIRPLITERLLMGRKESNQRKQNLNNGKPLGCNNLDMMKDKIIQVFSFPNDNDKHL